MKRSLTKCQFVAFEEWQVRWISTLGLAEIVGHEKREKSWGPSRDTFKQDEQLYLEHWRE
jgi:hypothetical protein